MTVEVFLDNEYIGSIKNKQELNTNTSSGKHILEIKAAGHADSKEFVGKPGDLLSWEVIYEQFGISLKPIDWNAPPSKKSLTKSFLIAFLITCFTIILPVVIKGCN